ncbi:hypothetical protein [Alkalihalobacillus trypoxylicola]|uniref:Uncharacterized protein n=1 Tax=Alkalihalobacillus trypoxylicola TaxID=519424 RepID=A0A162CQK7_9BACI|nr:hypothetical protein [Alkalihalobacillus trypoxylicola]KYG26034.1 hypothetical protein AZF04_13185 [Alkalihalobacillus trypoxylicola]
MKKLGTRILFLRGTTKSIAKAMGREYEVVKINLIKQTSYPTLKGLLFNRTEYSSLICWSNMGEKAKVEEVSSSLIFIKKSKSLSIKYISAAVNIRITYYFSSSKYPYPNILFLKHRKLFFR